MSGQEVEQALTDRPELGSQLQIPTQIVIHRSCRWLSREEVVQAIRKTVSSRAATLLESLDLEFAMPVDVASSDPGLRVTSIQFDRLHRQTRFELWTSLEPGNLPFFVTVPGDLAGGELSQSGTSQAQAAPALAVVHKFTAVLPPGGPVQHSSRDSKELVKPGVAARLVIQGEDYRITATVIPLQSGVLGQQIRVRDPATRKILNAQVAGPGLVTGTL